MKKSTIWCGIITLLLDQSAKTVVKSTLNSNKGISIIPKILDITYVENRGAAFGLLQGQTWLLIAMYFIIGLTATYIIYKVKLIGYIKESGILGAVSVGLIAGGGLSNLIDRLLHGYVIDYLQLSFFSPVCNVADYAISLGTIILLWVIFRVH